MNQPRGDVDEVARASLRTILEAGAPTDGDRAFSDADYAVAVTVMVRPGSRRRIDSDDADPQLLTANGSSVDRGAASHARSLGRALI